MKKEHSQYMHSLYAKGNEQFIDITTIYSNDHQEENHSNRKNPEESYNGCSVALPYPEVCVDGPNSQYLKLILEDYAGVTSEMTASNQYDYQKLILDYPNYREISQVIEAMSKVEKRHLSVLGELVILLGGDLRYWSIRKGTPQYWTPQYVNYTKNPRDILLSNIKAEELVIRQYNQHIQKINDAGIKEVLKRIVLDEQLHLEIFKDLYTKYFG